MKPKTRLYSDEDLPMMRFHHHSDIIVDEEGPIDLSMKRSSPDSSVPIKRSSPDTSSVPLNLSNHSVKTTKLFYQSDGHVQVTSHHHHLAYHHGASHHHPMIHESHIIPLNHHLPLPHHTIFMRRAGGSGGDGDVEEDDGEDDDHHHHLTSSPYNRAISNSSNGVNRGDTNTPTTSPTSSSSGIGFSSNTDKKRLNRPLTGRHVRHGTGASAQTLVKLRIMLQKRRRDTNRTSNSASNRRKGK